MSSKHTIDVNEFLELKEEWDKAQRKADQHQGALNALIADLKKSHGLRPEELTPTITRAERELGTKQKNYQKRLLKFQKDWQVFLGT